MNVEPDPGDEAFRAEVRAWLTRHVPDPPLPSLNTARGFAAHREWERTLAAAGLAVVSWPERYGGQDSPLRRWLVFEEEYYRAGAPVRVGQNGLFLLAPTLFAHGTDEQRDRILPPMATGDVIWAQAWSEPGAGSDLAAVRSTARRVEGHGGATSGWLLSGQKTWSSRAAFADKAFGLFRCDPPPAAVSAESSAESSAPRGGRHRGLIYLMFDLRAPGVTVRPIAQLDGEPGFAEIFLDDVFVPDWDVIGAPGDGWRIAMSTASHERGLSLRSPGRFLAAADRLLGLWQRTAAAAATNGQNPVGLGTAADERVAVPDGQNPVGLGTAIAEQVADAWIGARAYHLHTLGTVAALEDGGTLGAEASLGKVFWSELDIRIGETALDLLGPESELLDPAGPGGEWMRSYLFSLAGPIYAGTNEIQRSVIAERLLGLPR